VVREAFAKRLMGKANATARFAIAMTGDAGSLQHAIGDPTGAAFASLTGSIGGGRGTVKQAFCQPDIEVLAKPLP
jgi:hypothetical protein